LSADLGGSMRPSWAHAAAGGLTLVVAIGLVLLPARLLAPRTGGTEGLTLAPRATASTRPVEAVRAPAVRALPSVRRQITRSRRISAAQRSARLAGHVLGVPARRTSLSLQQRRRQTSAKEAVRAAILRMPAAAAPAPASSTVVQAADKVATTTSTGSLPPAAEPSTTRAPAPKQQSRAKQNEHVRRPGHQTTQQSTQQGTQTPTSHTTASTAPSAAPTAPQASPAPQKGGETPKQSDTTSGHGDKH